MTVATFPTARLWAGRDHFDYWVDTYWVDPMGNPTIYHESERWLSDPASWWGGPKDGRVLSSTKYKIALSDRTGQLQGTNFVYTKGDVDRLIRNSIANPLQPLVTAQQVIRAIFESDRLTHAIDPVVIFRGIVRGVAGTAPWGAKITGQDPLSWRIALNVPQRIVGLDLPGTPAANLTRLGPLLYGSLTDTAGASPTAAPTPTPDATSLSTMTQAGYEHLPGSGPTDLTLVDELNGIGQEYPGFFNGQNGEAGVYGMVWVVKGGTTPTDPFPYLPFTAAGFLPLLFQADPTMRGRQVHMTCSAAAGFDAGAGDLYAFACGELDPFGSGNHLWEQVIFSATPDVIFDTRIHTGFPGDPALSTGAVLPTVSGQYQEVATAIVSGVETAPSSVVTAFVGPYVRVPSWSFTTVVGATGYYVYRGTSGVGYDTRFTIPTTQTRAGNIYFPDDGSTDASVPVTSGPSGIPPSGTGAGPQGVVPTFDVGDFVALDGSTWGGYCVAAHAVKSVEATTYLHLSSAPTAGAPTVTVLDQATYSANVSVPGTSAFTALWGATPYRDTPSGARYALIYLTGAILAQVRASSAALFCNLQGVESVGDGSGDVLTSIYDQIGHFADNYVLPDVPYVGGLWLATPTWPDTASKRDTASFTQCKSDAAATIAAGDAVGWVVLTTTRIVDQLASLMLLAEARFALTKGGALRIVLQPPNAATPSPTAALTETAELGADTFTFALQTDQSFFWNTTAYQAAPTFDTAGSTSYGIAQTWPAPGASLRAYGLQPNPATIALPGLMSAARLAAVMGRIVNRAAQPASIATGTTGVNGLAIEIGDFITVVHREAPWAPAVPRLVQVQALSIDLDKQLVTFDAEDVELLGVGSFGDLLAGDIKVLFGDNNDRVTWTDYPSGAGAIHHGSKPWNIDSGLLGSGTYVLEVQGLIVAPGTTLTVGFFNLDAAPDVPIVTIAITATTPTRYTSAAITFAAAGVATNYGIKALVDAGEGYVYAASIVRTS